MHAAHLHPQGAQEPRPARHVDAHHLLDALTVAQAMSEAADAADAFGHIDILLEVSGLDQLFQPAVHEADIGDGFDDDFIF